ncbi:MAG: hypothetical protein ABFR19_05755 [Pseudomonadota bacterium]
MKKPRLLLGSLLWMLLLCKPFSAGAVEPIPDTPDELPELEEVLEMLDADEKPAGIVFVVYEYDESALSWIMPRLVYYATLIHQRAAELPVAVVSHGDEMLSLTTENAAVYPEVHFDLETLVKELDVLFHVCGSFAALNDLDESDFPDSLDVVPFAPAQVEDYRSLDYQAIEVELSL